MNCTIHLDDLECDLWTPKLGPDINPKDADTYQALNTEAGLVLSMMCKSDFGGWLAKHVSPLLVDTPQIVFYYTMMIDDAAAVVGHVAETDSKVTDKNRITYDLSAQWVNTLEDNIWEFQVDNEDWKWVDTGITHQFLPNKDYRIFIEAQIDYARRRSAIVAVTIDDERFITGMPSISGREEGWDSSQIVTQLQQCNNEKPGGYSLRFNHVKYLLFT